ncbi:MAG TPA: YggS family pyridoxal phosphate-dependent enzyme [Actinomycetota bacterium]|nr:YggS family pyridoxal phosphate-dependent enzyme [Actinomycetota bacterium]
MPADRELVHRNVADVRSRIAAAAARAGRDPADISLIAVTKTVASAQVRWAIEAGIRALGENYVQELRRKRGEVADATWHFIGTLQTGTAHLVADHADVVQTVAGERAARRLAGRAVRSGRILEALIEVDLTEGRTGVRPSELPSVADMITSLEGLHLAGLMTMPALGQTAEDARPAFIRLRELRDGIRERHPDVLALSMGMSLDYEVAVEEGATMVRIGTALFGPRATGPRDGPRKGKEPA